MLSIVQKWKKTFGFKSLLTLFNHNKFELFVQSVIACSYTCCANYLALFKQISFRNSFEIIKLLVALKVVSSIKLSEKEIESFKLASF